MHKRKISFDQLTSAKKFKSVHEMDICQPSQQITDIIYDSATTNNYMDDLHLIQERLNKLEINLTGIQQIPGNDLLSKINCLNTKMNSIEQYLKQINLSLNQLLDKPKPSTNEKIWDSYIG